MSKRPLIKFRSVFLLVVSITITLNPVMAQDATPFDVKIFDRLEWRSIGPANMGGRNSDIEGVPGNPAIVYVGSSSGGIFKTTNGGTTWTPLFQREHTISIGDLALEPGNPDVVWAGTGESNTRNSVSFGSGVYKSHDGGKSWQHLGLKETERISRIVINPHNPNIVYVGALGHAFGPNEERGVYMTTDGGKTWQKTLYIDREHGVADMDIHPSNPNVIYAGMWNFERKPWTFRSGSEQGGVFKSIDGGRTWKKVTEGLPKLMGRIGIKVAPSNPNVVYVIVESKEGTLYRSDDGGETFRQVSRNPGIVSRGFYYTDMRVDPENENRIYSIATMLSVSIDGGRSFRSITGRTHIDYHALWIDPKNPKRMWQGQDGGIAVSYDQGETWEYKNNAPMGQFYQIHADNRQPFYYVMGGLQDNGSWSGPSRTREPEGIMNDDWRMVSFGDGFYMFNHADDPELYLSESQGGNIVLTDMRTREQQLVRPWVGGGGPAANQKYRFNWNAPAVLSPHNKNTVYLGGNILFKSTDFGKTWTKISDDLTTNDPAKQKEAGGPISFENSTAEYHCTIISLAESPVKPGMIWVGTDDGNIQLTNDGGKTWNNLIKNVSGIPANSPVSHVEPSRANADVAYISFDRHMFDDFRSYVFKTTDSGKTWKNITGNLPDKGYVQIVREDPKNPNLIYAGTEIGLYASYTGGDKWIPLNLGNLPNVSVHDIVIHPRENDLIVGTHGRSIWVFDDATPIQQMSAEVAASDSHMFDIRPTLRFTTRFTRYGIGDALYNGPNPTYGALITYHLKEKPNAQTKVSMEILDSSGKVIRQIARVPSEKGINRFAWDLAYDGPKLRQPPNEMEVMFGGGPRGPQALPGNYTVRLLVGNKKIEKQVEVRMDPTVKVDVADLRTQFDHAMKLRDMVSAGNQALRTLDSIVEQLQQIDRTVKERMPDASADATKLIGDYIKQVEALSDKLGRRPGPAMGLAGSPKIIDRIGGLFGTIDGSNAAPTPAMREAFDEVRAAFPGHLNEVNKFITDTVPQMNEALRRQNLPTIIAGKTIEVPR